MSRFSWVRFSLSSLLLASVLAQATPSDPAQTARRRFIVHDKGLQQLAMDNRGEFGNPYDLPLWLPKLEYPRNSGTIFLFSAGLWVGGIREGVPIVSVCVDGNGTHEFGGLEFATLQDQAIPDILSIGWLAKSTDPLTTLDQEAALNPQDASPYGLTATGQGIRYLGLGTNGIDDDGDGRIDEDPAGDISCDYQDNDGDGLVDGDDPDFDGDLVPGSRDDDGDGRIDEDDTARAPQEFITAYVDTCASCVERPDVDGFTPLGIRVVQHSYQWHNTYADDFIIYEYKIQNIGDTAIMGLAVGFFADFVIGSVREFGTGDPGGNDWTAFYHGLNLAAMYDPSNLYIEARYAGVCWIDAGADAPIAYANYRLPILPAHPGDNAGKYALMTSAAIDSAAEYADYWYFILSAGPLGDLEPGASRTVVLALVNGVEEQDLLNHATYAKNMWENGLLGPSAPAAPVFTVRPVNRGVEILWADNAEACVDRLTGRPDFQGYHIWRTEDGQSWTLAASYDLPDTIGFNLGWPPPGAPGGEYAYRFVDTGLMNGARLRYVVTAFDDGDNGDGINTEAWDMYHDGTGVLESDRSPALQQAVVPAEGPAAEGCVDSVYVVPNPYRGSSVLDRWGVDGRGIIEFRGLPPACDLAIYTLAGDLVRELTHNDGSSWEAWDVRNFENREVAGGVYIYRVSSGKNERIGKFMVIR